MVMIMAELALLALKKFPKLALLSLIREVTAKNLIKANLMIRLKKAIKAKKGKKGKKVKKLRKLIIKS